MIAIFLVLLPILAICFLWLGLYIADDGNEFFYITQYPVDICLDYMKHENMYDLFDYTWEEIGGRYFITFIKRKSNVKPFNMPKPVFEVVFTSVDRETKIKVIYLKSYSAPVPLIGIENVDLFWNKKLNAIKYEKNN